MVKVKIGENKANVATFPCLKSTSKGLIVLFTKPGSGTVLKSDCAANPLGYFCDTWRMEFFENMNENITLVNE